MPVQHAVRPLCNALWVGENPGCQPSGPPGCGSACRYQGVGLQPARRHGVGQPVPRTGGICDQRALLEQRWTCVLLRQMMHCLAACLATCVCVKPSRSMQDPPHAAPLLTALPQVVVGKDGISRLGTVTFENLLDQVGGSLLLKLNMPVGVCCMLSALWRNQTVRQFGFLAAAPPTPLGLPPSNHRWCWPWRAAACPSSACCCACAPSACGSSPQGSCFAQLMTSLQRR